MTVRTQRRADQSQPREGERLEAAAVAARLKVTLRTLAEAAGISPTSMFMVIGENKWPVKVDRADIVAAVEKVLQEAGATEQDMATLWHAHAKRSGLVTTDKYGRPIDEPLPYPHERFQQPKDTDMLLAKQTLSMSAKRAFKLFSNPFDGEVLSDDQMFVSDEIRFVREAVWQCATHAGFVALVAESGGGKTTILEDLESRIQREHKSVMVMRPSVLGMEESHRGGVPVKSHDIVSAIIRSLDPSAQVPGRLESATKKVVKLLSDSVDAGFQHLVVIEEAHSMSDFTLKHLKRLHELKLGRRPLLGILLLGQPELAAKLDPKKAHLREVTQRVEVVQLLPLDNDLQPYLQHRARLAQRGLEEFIDAGGVEELRARLTLNRPGATGKTRTVSLLYPLAVNNLMTACLNTAAELGVPMVTRDVVRAV